MEKDFSGGIQAFLQKELTVPNIPNIHEIKMPNPAKWMYERLMEYINNFEKDLDEDHEIGARLVSFGQTVTFHIQEIGYYGPDIISFYGINENNETVQLIQHISQLSVLLIAMTKIGDVPRRIGFEVHNNGNGS